MPYQPVGARSKTRRKGGGGVSPGPPPEIKGAKRGAVLTASKNVSPAKAKKILADGKVHGKALSPKQRRLFGAIARGASEGAVVAAATDSTAVLTRAFAERGEA